MYYESTWSREDGLIKKKHWHRSITIGDAVYHVGGFNSYGAEPEYIEKWTGLDSNIGKETKKLIDGQIFYPEVLAVSADFCN